MTTENPEPEIPAASPSETADTDNPITDEKKLSNEVRRIYYREIIFSPSVVDPRRLIFVAAKDAPPSPPEGLLTLRQDFERTARVVSVLFEADTSTRKSLFELLHIGADRGLRGPDFNIQDGRSNLESIQETIVDNAYKVRNERLRDYFRLMLKFGVGPLVLGIIVFIADILNWLPQIADQKAYNLLLSWALAVCWIPAGAACCVWGEFALRMQSQLSYEQLLSIDPSRWRAGQRVGITIGISFILAFLLAFDFVQVGLGGVLLNDFDDKSPALALAVGGVTALSFTAVRDIIFRMVPSEQK